MDYLQYIGEDPLKMYWRTEVLNLIINGLPSIRQLLLRLWLAHPAQVLNLIINGLPSILRTSKLWRLKLLRVLNLIINGLPSIPTCEFHSLVFSLLLWF